MPLYEGAEKLIRENLEACAQGKQPRLVTVGQLSQAQLAAINAEREEEDLPPIDDQVVFRGKHMYKSRCKEQGYTIDDVIQQITSAMHESSVAKVTTKMTTIQRLEPRKDAYGNEVCDQAVFECTTKHPHPELFSVIPRGDTNRPGVKKASGPR